MATATEQHGHTPETNLDDDHSSITGETMVPSSGRMPSVMRPPRYAALPQHGFRNRRNDLSRILANCLWFRSLDPQALQEIMSIGREIEIAKSKNLFRTGDQNDDVYVILSGRIMICSTGANGRDIGFREYATGDCFGELAALDGLGRSATARALTTTRLFRIPSADFRRVLASHPDVAAAVLRSMAGLVRALSERIADYSTRAGVRIVAELVRLAEAKLGSAGGARASICPAPTDEDLAARLDTQREAVNRVINDLKRRRLIERNRSCLIVLDLPALQRHLAELRG
ncbi:MAG TPA: Crp/Fnr family transcriptional regulator [Geminicoccus sp.]|uniref:Crp/Fnr family transcriptional regulator n=1 Tax=Geminicoccus sp. TaxID=2024832 RepID=UPI002E34B7F8|nr:Crp/Fnr family transcriptional regulator [Geminicoccus sp.]HEX2525217.1 Crp/Fnr family transcriptional regulator [Geminicoccus sp.]